MLKRNIIIGCLLGCVLLNCKQANTEEKVNENEIETVVTDPKVTLIKNLKLEGMEFKIPETDNVRIILASVNPSDTVSVFSYYDDMERGKVFLDQRKVLPIQSAYFIIPFHISNQGSGVFNYLGLFKTDEKNGRPMHLGSYFLGDRIQNLAIASMENQLVVNYNSHGEEQAFSDFPKVKNSVALEIKNDQLLQKISNQWLEKVEAKIKIIDASGHGPDLGSDEWCNAVSRKLTIDKPIQSQEWIQAVEEKLK